MQQHTPLTRQRLRLLPGVDRLLAAAVERETLRQAPKPVLVRAIRETLDGLRREILEDPESVPVEMLSLEPLMDRIAGRLESLTAFNLQRAVNAAGVVVHTNLGRSCLAPSAVANVALIAANYSNLEFDLQQGRRGSRYSAVEELICELTGAEAAMVVNNNAAAVLLCLDTLAHGREVIISRGELVEIGGSFRIPDVMAKSGAILKEVGTTNRTHARDYEQAIGSQTGLLLKVHASNFSIVGFTAAVPLSDIVGLASKFNLPVMEDLGSGNLIDLRRYGLAAEPTVQESVAAGADVVTFSGDKLLGGPQAGLIVGRRAMVDQIKRNALTRALRIDKMTLAALEATLRLYRDETAAMAEIPTLRMITEALPLIETRARALADALAAIGDTRLKTELRRLPSRTGGGALPMLELPSCCLGVQISGRSVNSVEKALRTRRPPIIGRIEEDWLILDLRTVQSGEIEIIAAAFRNLLLT